MIIWLTGSSKAGKTTIAKELKKLIPSVILDGDSMRESISLGAGFSKEDRREHNLRVARLAKVLEEQTTVLISVIAPLKEARAEVDKICKPTWIYIKRTLPDREGHFYEEPDNYFTVDHDKLNVMESVEEIKKYLKMDRNGRSYFFGRFQPPHSSHVKLIRKVLDEEKEVCIGLRPGGDDEKNPYDFSQRFDMFYKEFKKEMDKGSVIIFPLPDDVAEIIHGRKVGYAVREIRLDPESEAVSATQIRKEKSMGE